ncbi:MAG: hypothetical protein EXS36_01565 [Pedosphaera sp.]|nr:hypothetical protein [Pedosphaera sp.]
MKNLLMLTGFLTAVACPQAAPAFPLKVSENRRHLMAQRGYYLCFMRMPTFGLAAWKEILDDELRAILGRELFGGDWQPTQVDELLFLFQVFNTDRDWSVPGALTTPGLVKDRAERGKLGAKKRGVLREQLTRIRAIAARHRDAATGGAKELHRIAQWLADQWIPENEKLLNP